MTTLTTDQVLCGAKIAIEQYRMKMFSPFAENLPGDVDEYRESALAWVTELLPRLKKRMTAEDWLSQYDDWPDEALEG